MLHGGKLVLPVIEDGYRRWNLPSAGSFRLALANPIEPALRWLEADRPASVSLDDFGCRDEPTNWRARYLQATARIAELEAQLQDNDYAHKEAMERAAYDE